MTKPAIGRIDGLPAAQLLNETASPHISSEFRGSSPDPPAVSPSSPTRRDWFLGSRAGAITLIVTAAIIFSTVSLGLSTLATRQYSATATVLVQPDPSLVGLTPDPPADGSDRFDQAQIIALQKLVENTLPVQRRTGLAAISITQVGLTDVLQISASAPVAADAVASANLLLDDYVSGRRKALVEHIKTAVTEVDNQLATVIKALRPSGNSKSVTSSKAVTAGLTAEYGRLVSLRNQIKMVAATATSTTVVSRASDTDISVASNKARNALLAGLLGALAATGALLLRQRLATGRAPTNDPPTSPR